MTDNVNKPRHYQGKYGLEVIDVMRNFIGDLSGMSAGYWKDTVKYLLRFQKKNGLEDLKKAKKNLEWLIEEEERKNGLRESESPYCPRGVPGIKDPGIEGRTQYTHIAYATSPDGHENFNLNPPDFDEFPVYMGFYTDFEKESSLNPDDYKWVEVL